MKLLILLILTILTVVTTLSAQVPNDSILIQTEAPHMQVNILIDGTSSYQKGIFLRNETGMVQTFTCQDPNHYRDNEGKIGWACYDSTRGVWLLNALGPQIQPVNAMPTQCSSPVVAYPSQFPPTPQVIFMSPVRSVIGGVGEVVVLSREPGWTYPRSDRVVITRDSIHEAGRVLSSMYRGRR